MVLTEGQQHEATVAETLIDFIHANACIADGGYDADHIIGELKSRGIVPVIPPRATRLKKRRYDKRLYELRYLVECFFHSIKRFRRIATRYDKTATCYYGFLLLACAMQWV